MEAKGLDVSKFKDEPYFMIAYNTVSKEWSIITELKEDDYLRSRRLRVLNKKYCCEDHAQKILDFIKSTNPTLLRILAEEFHLFI